MRSGQYLELVYFRADLTISEPSGGCSAFPKYLYQAKLNGSTVLLPELGDAQVQ